MKSGTVENGARTRDSKSKVDAKSNGSKTAGGTANGNKVATAVTSTAKARRNANVLLSTLIAFKRGNLSVRMPVDQTDLEGKDRRCAERRSGDQPENGQRIRAYQPCGG
jgi:hypothetical protein